MAGAKEEIRAYTRIMQPRHPDCSISTSRADHQKPNSLKFNLLLIHYLLSKILHVYTDTDRILKERMELQA